MINYYLITKPGIILGNLVTLAAGFLLAAKGNIDFLLFFETLLGLALIMASACVFNNYIDRKVDSKMERTKNRLLVTGEISVRSALTFASGLGLLGALVLWISTNPLTVFIAAVGFFVYVVLYSLWKCHTIYGTAIGSVAGAIPPLVGYCAVSNRFDTGAIILFAMLVLWQMPHFFSIALYHFKDYKAAGIPVLPIMKGMYRTKVHMVIYILCFIVTSTLLTVYNYTGYVYLTVALGSGIAWLWLCIKGFERTDDELWGKQMFQVSLLLITAICIAIPLDIIKPV